MTQRLGCGLDGPLFDSRCKQDNRIFSSSDFPDWFWGLTRSTIQWVSGVLTRGRKVAGGFNLTTHLHVVPTLGMSGVTPLFPLYAFMA
jgi:hypothetical protein